MLMTALLVFSALAFLALRARIRKATRQRRAQTFGYYLQVSFLDFLKMLLLVLAFYAGVSIFVGIFPEVISTGGLVRLENGLAKLAMYSKLFKISSIATVLALLGLYALGLWKFLPALELYKKISKRVYQVLVLLCCFTLLGFEAGSPSVTLSLRIKRNREGYEVLQQKVSQALDERLAAQLVQKISDSFPPQYVVDGLDRVSAANTKIGALEQDYRDLTQSGGSNSELRLFLNDHPSVDSNSSDNAEDSQAAPAGAAEDPDSPVDRLDSRQIESMTETVDAISSRRDRELGEKLTLELIKSAREGVKGQLLTSLIKEFPIFDPVSDIFSSAFDKYMQAKVKKMADHIASLSSRDTSAMDSAITRGAYSLSQSIKIEPTPQVHARELRALQGWHSQLHQIDVFGETVPAQVEEVKDRAANQAALRSFMDGIKNGWVVSRNPYEDPSRLFIHAAQTEDGALKDLQFVAKENADGTTWTIYLPPTDGGEFGKKVGTIEKPAEVEVIECTCT